MGFLREAAVKIMDRGPGGKPAMHRALGISIHTGWGACVVVGGSLLKPEIIANEVMEILDDSERFCFHVAADMKRAAAEKWIARMREKAVANAARALSHLVSHRVGVCAVLAKQGDTGDLGAVLASHPRIHAAEGFFYRDVLRDACPVPTLIVSPSSFDPSKVGKFAAAPWGRDQKLAALAAWSVIENTSCT
jgi:hypothetical protein